MKKSMKLPILTLLLLAVFGLKAKATAINIMQYGAKADGKTVNTKAIQRAIDECSKTSGTVIIPQGAFITGTIYLKSNVTLYLEKGATLLGSLDSADYTRNSPVTVKCMDTHSRNGKSKANMALVYAENQ